MAFPASEMGANLRWEGVPGRSDILILSFGRPNQRRNISGEVDHLKEFDPDE
jgi:hypothetical protein